jgi:hypothetical protein
MLSSMECVFFFMDQFRNNLHYFRKLIETIRLVDTGEICLTGVIVITEVTQNTQNTIYVFLHI